PVRLVGVADSILRAPNGAGYCAIELKLGRCAPVVDLAQAALYHLILGRSRRAEHNGSGSALALLRFSPELEERLVDAAAIDEAQQRLLDVIAELAEVKGPISEPCPRDPKPPSKPLDDGHGGVVQNPPRAPDDTSSNDGRTKLGA